MTTAITPPVEGPVPVHLRDVERELSRQMKTMQGSDETPVQRARMSNLVIFCNQKDRAQLIANQVPEIVSVHPARVLLLIGESNVEGAEVQASVLVRPQREGMKQQACMEQVTLYAAGGAVSRLPFAVRALVIGDLPTNLWWASDQPPSLAGIMIHELSENAQQIMYDSLGWTDPVRAVAATATWLDQAERGAGGGRWRVASDLNWRRLKYWRRLVSQALDPASAPGASESVTEISVEHGPHAVIQAWELVSWLARRLGWSLQGGRVQPDVEICWSFAAPHGEVRVRVKRLDQGPPELRRMRIACKLAGKPGALNLVKESESRLAILLEGVDGAPRTVTLPGQSPAELIGRQLSDREPDPVFRESMAVAQALAQSLLR